MAQPTPQSPADAAREERAARNYNLSDQWDEREQRREARRMRRWCDEWRERVARHPRLILPRACWRR